MISQQTMTALKDYGQLLGYFVAVPVGAVGLVKAVYEIGANRRQRADELRWKQANAAKELLDDIHNQELARQAIHMLDWSEGGAEYKIRDDGLICRINYPDVLKALAMNRGEAQDDRSAYIRDCFDWLFYRIDRIEHYIRRGLIQFDDVEDVFRVYAREVAKHEQVYRDFLHFHEYDLARQFFDRFEPNR
jgi:hypothetical protein